MCLAIPAKIIKINGNEAVAEISNVQRDIRIDLIEDCKVGDHVLLHAGFAINKLDQEALRETREAFVELEKSLSEK